VIAVNAWERFRTCPGCAYDFATGEGAKACHWGDCAYLPEELNVFGDECRFDYLTMEGNNRCEDPLACEHAAAPLAHVENYRRWQALVGTP
jgi:hypothetical protein